MNELIQDGLNISGSLFDFAPDPNAAGNDIGSYSNPKGDGKTWRIDFLSGKKIEGVITKKFISFHPNNIVSELGIAEQNDWKLKNKRVGRYKDFKGYSELQLLEPLLGPPAYYVCHGTYVYAFNTDGASPVAGSITTGTTQAAQTLSDISNIASQVKSVSNQLGGSNIQNPTSSATIPGQPAAPQKSNKAIFIIGGSVLGIGLIILLLTKILKKKS